MDAIGIDGGILVFGGVAECDCCAGPDCDYPLLDVTLTWTDSDTTKNYLGYTFTNGETIAVCPETYSCLNVYNPPPTSTPFPSTLTLNQHFELWGHYGSGSYETPKAEVLAKQYTTYLGTPFQTTFTFSRDASRIRLSNNTREFARYGVVTYHTDGIGNSLVVRRGGSDKVTTWHRYNRDTATYSYQGSTGPFRQAILTDEGIDNVGGNTPVRSNFDQGITDDFEGSITSAGGLTITWAKNHTGVPWGDCFI